MAVVIPCWREKAHILGVLERIPPVVQQVFVIDDACPDGTGAFVEAECPDPRVTVLVHEQNKGVGGATVTGYRAALETDAEIIVRMDGDGQMDGRLIERLLAPIRDGHADYAKGNRFYEPASLASMPRIRLAGNAGLSFMAKFSSGYWHLFDPNNGFTAVHAEVLRILPLHLLAERWFFESDMLFRLGTVRAAVIDVPIPAVYGAETSHLSVWRAIPRFAWKHTVNSCKRFFYNYWLRDFSVASLQLVIGVAAAGFGLVFGSVNWGWSLAVGGVATAGTVMVAGLPAIVGIQLILAFLNYDVLSVPKLPLHPRLGKTDM